MRKFFAYGFLPAPWTHISGVHKLPQGHCLELDLDTLQPEIQRYWRYAILPDAAPPGSPSQWAEELDALLGRAVAGRLDSDVPLGVFLSGGIDSSTILSHAADARGGGTIDSFAIGFREPSFDESAHAARMADHVGSRHHLSVCDLAQVRELILDLPAIIDEPLGDSSILPTYLLSGFARQHVTVALSGGRRGRIAGRVRPVQGPRDGETLWAARAAPRPPCHRRARAAPAALRDQHELRLQAQPRPTRFGGTAGFVEPDVARGREP